MDIAIRVVNVMPFCKCYGIGNMLVRKGGINLSPGTRPAPGSRGEGCRCVFCLFFFTRTGVLLSDKLVSTYTVERCLKDICAAFAKNHSISSVPQLSAAVA